MLLVEKGSESFFFYDLESKLDSIGEQLKTLHEKYFVFELSELTDIAPSQVLLLSKIYVEQNSLTIENIYHMKLKNFIKRFVDK